MLDHHNELCWTCVHESSCMTLDLPGRPVLDCEEFSVVDGQQPPAWEEQVPTDGLRAGRRASRACALIARITGTVRCGRWRGESGTARNTGKDHGKEITVRCL
jgi:hypothetical protein